MLGTRYPQDRLDLRQALVAAVPPLLFGLGIALKALIGGGPWYALPLWRLAAGLSAELISAAALFAGGLIALMRGLPDWGYTWIGAALTTLALGLNVLAEERAESGLPLVSPAADIAIVVLLLLVGLTVLCLAALRGWSRAGLVSIGLSTVLALSLCSTATNAPFYRYDLAFLAVPLGLLTAALTYLYARRPGPVRIVAMVAIGLASVAVALLVSQAWESWLAARGRPSPLLPLLVLLAGSLVAGPALGAFAPLLRRAIRRT
jgi:hypothetical protein